MRDIDEFILRHQGWLEARLDKYPDRPKLRPGVKLPVRGANHVIVHEPAKRGAVEQGLDEDGAYLIVHGEHAHLGRRLADFLKRIYQLPCQRFDCDLEVSHLSAQGYNFAVHRLLTTFDRAIFA